MVMEVVVFLFPLFFLAFLNWGTCTCMERRGEEVEDDDDEELLGWGDWVTFGVKR